MSNLLETARKVIRMETEAVQSLEDSLDERFLRAIDLMLHCKGRVVTTGMGKAGLIARKVAATLASTGTPSFFMHPGEGVHGDLGMITSDDVVVAYSNAGETEEVLRILPYLKHFGTPLVAVTSNPNSTLAKNAEVALEVPVKFEACPMNLAPTSSTTAMLALGDALALVLLEARGFQPEDYALRHPGGSLGRRLLTKVGDIMHRGEDNPVVSEDATLQEAIFVMSRSKLAATSVSGAGGKLTGFFTDGDMRRYLLQGAPDLQIPIRELMTKNPKRAWPDMMAVKALEILREFKIIELPVVDEDDRPIGMVHLHDITRAGIT
ncbi:MAG TPA: KpsF/GutQ family sugar-phosphate isomerase [Fimbriimonas sp.]